MLTLEIPSKYRKLHHIGEYTHQMCFHQTDQIFSQVPENQWRLWGGAEAALVAYVQEPAAIFKGMWKAFTQASFVQWIKRFKNQVTVEKIKYNFISHQDVWVHDRSSKSGSEEMWMHRMINDILACEVLWSKPAVSTSNSFCNHVLDMLTCSPSFSPPPPQKYSWMTSCWHTQSSWRPTSSSRSCFSSIQYISISRVHLRSMSFRVLYQPLFFGGGVEEERVKAHHVQSGGVVAFFFLLRRGAAGFVCLLSGRIWNLNSQSLDDRANTSSVVPLGSSVLGKNATLS